MGTFLTFQLRTGKIKINLSQEKRTHEVGVALLKCVAIDPWLCNIESRKKRIDLDLLLSTIYIYY